MRQANPYSYDKQDNPVIEISTVADMDWLRAYRLAVKAGEGDEQAKNEFDRMNAERLMVFDQSELDHANT